MVYALILFKKFSLPQGPEDTLLSVTEFCFSYLGLLLYSQLILVNGMIKSNFFFSICIADYFCPIVFHAPFHINEHVYAGQVLSQSLIWFSKPFQENYLHFADETNLRNVKWLTHIHRTIQWQSQNVNQCKGSLHFHNLKIYLRFLQCSKESKTHHKCTCPLLLSCC